MNSKRELKRSLNYVCSELFAECVASSLSKSQDDRAEVDPILTCILRVHSDFIKRVSHPEPGMPAHKYYQVLIADFNKQVDEIIDQIQALG